MYVVRVLSNRDAWACKYTATSDQKANPEIKRIRVVAKAQLHLLICKILVPVDVLHEVEAPIVRKGGNAQKWL